jgi:hypothetical protein
MIILHSDVKCALVATTSDQTINWTPDLTQIIEILRTIRLNLDQQRIVKDIGYKLESNYETTLELDSHANTCVLVHDALIVFGLPTTCLHCGL